MATPFLVLLFVDPETGQGWRMLFIGVGGVGAAWALLWMLNTRGDRGREIDAPPTADEPAATSQPGGDPDVPDAPPVTPPPTTPFLAVFGISLFWICLGTGIFVNVCWHFYNQWFPRYLTEDLRISARTEQLVLAGFFIAADIGSMLSGWTTRKLVRARFSVERSRQLVMTGLGLIVLAASVPAALLPVDLLGAKYAMFFVVAAAAMGGFAIFFSLAQDILPRHTAKILGVCGCLSWLAISGVTKAIGAYDLAGPGKYAGLFLVIGCSPLVAAAVGWFWPGPRGRTT
jgi:sugar phosphate permease